MAIPSLQPTSATLVGGLCREIDRLRRRAAQVLGDLGRCQHPGLLQRLQTELDQLRRRHAELAGCVGGLRQVAALRDPLALAFLEELVRRPLVLPARN